MKNELREPDRMAAVPQLDRNPAEAALRAKLMAAQDDLAEREARVERLEARVAQLESTLAQREEEAEQAWAAVESEKDRAATLLDAMALVERKRDEADQWVFRLAGERQSLEREVGRLERRIRASERARLAAEMTLQNERAASEAKRNRVPDILPLPAVSLEQSQAVDIEALARAEGQRRDAEAALADRFGEIAVLTRMLRDKEEDAARYRRQADWGRQLAICLLEGGRSPGWLPRSLSKKQKRLATRRQALFNEASYLAIYPDVRESGIDPLLHYLRHGMSEGRQLHDSADDDGPR